MSISHIIVTPFSAICFYSSGIMDRSAVDQPLYLSWAVTIPPPVCFPIYPPIYLAILFRRMLVVIII
jgi:hypothetical protein